jgi:hypothetical protein
MTLPSPETMLTYASILEKPQRDHRGALCAPSEIITAAAEALRMCATVEIVIAAMPAADREQVEAIIKSAPPGELKPLPAGEDDTIKDRMVRVDASMARQLRLALEKNGRMLNWLRRQGSAETDPVKRSAFIEAHNALSQIPDEE